MPLPRIVQSRLCKHSAEGKGFFLALHLLNVGLTWADVDFRRQTIAVRTAYAKNGEARSVPMTVVLTETLKASRINAAPTAPVFLTPKGQPYRDISRAFGTAVRRAVITDFTFHDLRHTFASHLVMGEST
jgi:integrase